MEIEQNLVSIMEYLQKRFSEVIDNLHNDKYVDNLKVLIKDSKAVRYEDITWIFEEVNFLHPSAAFDLIGTMVVDSEDFECIRNVISEDLPYKYKLILVLGFLEPYIYNRLCIVSGNDIKNDVELLLNRDHKLDLEDHKRAVVYAIVCIIYKNFKNPKRTPDKRLPHRNVIFHNGIQDYKDEEIELAYQTLIAFVYILTKYTENTVINSVVGDR